MRVLVRIPGQGTDFPVEDLTPDDTVLVLKQRIAQNHPKTPSVESQRLISGGKLLENGTPLSDLHLNPEAPVVHLVISEPVAPEPEPSPVEPIEQPPTQLPSPPTEPFPEIDISPISSPAPETASEPEWITPQLKEYFKVWDLSIRCYELSESHSHMAPRLKLYKALIMANQKQRALGTSGSAGNVRNAGGNNADMPRQNVDRDNAVVGAQGAVDDDGPQDWLDRFYTLFRLSLMLFFVYNYSSTERFFAVLVIALSIMLYQAGFFRLQRRRRPNEGAAENAAAGGNEAAAGNGGEPERPGIFRMLWIFLSQFVASLIPQNNAPVNAN